MIDLQTETPLSFTEAAKLPQVCRNGKRPAISTLWRWAGSGCRGVKLEVRRVGGTLCTTAAAVDRFLAALNGEAAATPGVTPRMRDKAIASAERELDAAGVR
jgi:hypothetical protein